MKMKICLASIISGFILLAFSVATQADQGVYAGASYSKVSYEASGGELDFSAIGGILGYNLSSTFGLEARYSEGRTDDDANGHDVEIDKVASIFGRLSLANDTNVTPYALIGYTKGWLDIAGYGGDSDSDFSYGAGLGFELAKGLSIAAEYVVLIDKDDYDFNQVGVNLVYTF